MVTNREVASVARAAPRPMDAVGLIVLAAVPEMVRPNTRPDGAKVDEVEASCDFVCGLRVHLRSRISGTSYPHLQ